MASIKPNNTRDFRNISFQFMPGGRFVTTNLPLLSIIAEAYDLSLFNIRPERLSGGPAWIRTESYDIEATAPASAGLSGLSVKDRDAKMRMMLRALLAERFQLATHRENKPQSVYALTVAKGGPKLTPAKTAEKDCPEKPARFEDACHALSGGQGRGIHARGIDMTELARALEGMADHPVINETGLTGLFDVETEGWVPLIPRPPRLAGTEPTAEDLAFADPARPTLFTVLEGLGLKLERRTVPVEGIVIDGVERPSPN